MITEYISIGLQLAGFLMTVLTAVWYLTSKLERVQACLAAQSKLIEEKIGHLEQQLTELKDEFSQSRNDLTTLRERVARMESK